MAQWGRPLTTLPEGLSYIFSSHKGSSQPPVPPVPEDLTLSSYLIGIPCTLHRHAGYPSNIKINKSKKVFF